MADSGSVQAEMRAWRYSHFGGPDMLEQILIQKPIPKPNEVLVKVRATTVSSADWRALSHRFPPGLGFPASFIFGFSKPRHSILGNEFAGEVEAVGQQVTRFKAGDAVAGQTGLRFGTHTEYVAATENASLIPMPTRLSFEEAASMSFGGMTVLGFLGMKRLKPGDTMLVNGASGTVGTAAVQIAKAYGATVTAVCSADNADFVRTLGADDVIDYNRTDFARIGKTWDVILDAAGTAPFPRAALVLNKNGRLLRVNGTLGDILRAPMLAITSDKRIVTSGGSPGYDAMAELARLIEQGSFTPVVGKIYPFEQIAAAYRNVASGRKRGSIVLNPATPLSAFISDTKSYEI